MNKEAVLSISGGLDSTALLVHLLNKDYKKIHAISFYYGQKNEIELQKYAEFPSTENNDVFMNCDLR